MKIILRTLLIALAVYGLGFWAWGKATGRAALPEGTAHAAPNQSETQDGVVVTYFTTDVRCESCREIEAQTRRTVEERFAGELAAGKIRFATTNIDRPEIAHFAKDYEIAFKTVVIAGREPGTAPVGTEAAKDWKKMDDVWALFVDPEKFIDYLATEIQSRLGASS